MLTEKMVRISLNGDSETVAFDVWNETADALVAKHGGGVPKVEWVESTEVQPAAPVVALVTVPTAPIVVSYKVEDCKGCGNPLTEAPCPICQAPRVTIRGGQHDIVGEARSTVDLEAAQAAGFAPAQTVYTRGTRVIQLGVDNARSKRAEFDAKPTVSDYCEELIGKVESEDREDVTAAVADVQMSNSGNVTIVHETGPDTVFAVEERSFPSLVTDLYMPAGAATFLSQVWPEMRAQTINTWTTQWSEDEKEERDNYREGEEQAPETSSLVLRTRVTGGESRSIFATVSESYTSFDVDQVARAIGRAVPPDARGTVTYDGYKARFEVLFHSDVKPEDYVAGEFFRAGVVVTTDDTGGGSLRGNAVVWQNLCLNLIVIDEANQDLFRLRHVGSVDKLAEQFRKGFEQALAKLDHFVKAWGYASRENLAQYLPAEAKAIPIGDAIPGFFNGIIERELVPVRGRRVEAVKHLVQAWRDDDSSATVHHKGFTRAALANAFTRYAHTVAQPSVWVEDEIQRAAGALVQASTPLPYLPLAKED